MKLILRLLMGIAGGIIIGLVANERVARFMVTISDIIGSFIFFMVPLIIIFFIAAGIANLGKGGGKLLGSTIGIAYLSTILAGAFAVSVAMYVFPLIGLSGSEAAAPEGLRGFIEFEIEPIAGVLTALVLAFVLGVGIAATEATSFKRVIDEGQSMIEMIIRKAIIPLLPFYIAGVLAEMAYEGAVFETLGVFGVVLALAVSMHLIWLVIQYTVAGIVNKENPFRLMKNMVPAYVTALGTMSSAATIPVTVNAVKKNRIKDSIADFVVPLCANIHLSGSTITILTAATAVMYMMPGLEFPGFVGMIPVILMLGIIMIAAPGVPGGAVMAAVGILSSMLGFNEAAIALMIALYLAQDSFGTATNVTGDGAIALIMNGKDQNDSDRDVA
ncbi:MULTISPECIES: dicarboxylate/amino acid:cation symporter [Shouchella]|uniref:Dicarboxylate/amino acid:cation symporter n=1 Tax=Shouchella hunanensis TaxID=766894 RepID=A0ABY7WBI7_9BACI|nr:MULTISPECIES: dicarboxylate/amino acid:cation symporter [Shouchella]WDF05814.1 dicarboxylate/amino acid:cation symporter [Shouchella hunanensis]